MTTIGIKSQKGAVITLSADANGFVTANVNGAEFRGNHDDFGVQMFGSTSGEYLQLAKGGAAIIAVADIPGAAAFFKAAKAMVHASQAKIATAKHMANMANPAYAAQYASDRLTADMDRANSNN